MTFNPNIPQPNDFISQSQSQILANFGVLSTAWNINHVDFNVTNDGKHKYVEFPNQGSDPAGAATEMTLFSKLDSASVSNLFYKRNNAGSSFQVTGPGDPVNAQGGQSFLPGGILIQWGNVNATTTGAAVVYSSAFTNVFGITISSNATTSQARILWASNITTTGFNAFTDHNTAAFWIAIGN